MHPDFENVKTHGEEHLTNVEFLMEELNLLHGIKEQTYKGSWAKRGLVGAFYNVARPWDRITNAFIPEDGVVFKHNLVQRYLFDALVDVALYCLKMAVAIADIDREVYVGWAEENLGRAKDWPYDTIEDTD